jgi:hypothetical protein
MDKPYLGIWLDHRDAYLIWADEQGQVETQHAQAGYEERRKRAGGVVAGAGVHGGVPPHTDIADKRRRQARLFYEELFRDLQRARQVYLFGPGQAKRELARALGGHRDFTGAVAGVEGAEKMTPPQMVAQVKAFFRLPRVAA